MRVAIVLIFASGAVFAEAPVVQRVTMDAARIDVTVLHPDTGWGHYADGWAVEDAQGSRLGLRVLAHPHETEQPFTRSLTVDVPLPDVVFIRTRCIVDGWSDDVFEVAVQ